MTEHRKISRILQLIARLRSPVGCTKDELARDFDVTIRTIERHLNLLEEIGFKIEQLDTRFYITNISRDTFKQEDLIVFNLEEAGIIKDALLGHHGKTALHNNVLNKLYALTELDSLAETIGSMKQSFTIGTIRWGIKHKRRIILKNYQSLHSTKTTDRLIEPIRFQNYFLYLIAYEVDSHKIKIFKTERITDALPTDIDWQFEKEHKKTMMDVFGISDNYAIPIKLKLTKRAQQLLEEEFPDSKLHIITKGGNTIFESEVYGFEGVGRFVMGLLDEIEIIEPPELKNYIRQKIDSFSRRQ